MVRLKVVNGVNVNEPDTVVFQFLMVRLKATIETAYIQVS